MSAKPLWIVLLFLALLAPASALGAGELNTPAGSASAEGPLPELPHLAPVTTGEADPGAVRDLERLLERLTSEDGAARADAKNALGEMGLPIVNAIRRRVHEIRATLDREAAPRVLEAARKAGRKNLHSADSSKPSRKKERDAGSHKADDEPEGDWLEFLLATPRPGDSAWRDVTSLVGMERMLAAVGTTPAVRELVSMHAYFGDLLRIDLQRQIAKLRDKAVPALIEARQHDAKLIQRWANKELDVLGKAIPGEAVATSDPQLIADVLRAYGRTRDVDAVRVILSYCNSERTQLREASREAIAAIGEPSVWQLRDQYLGLTGEKPPRAWTWDRIARELFAIHDRGRLAELGKLMDEGLKEAASGKAEAAVVAFDKVLARSPLFDRRKEMVVAYVARAKELSERDHEAALALMRKARRLDPKREGSKVIDAEVAFLEGLVSVDEGLPDKSAFRKALELDPTHERARAALASLEDKAVARQSHLKRQLAAGGIGILAVLAMVLVARWRGKPTGGGAAPTAPTQGSPPEKPADPPAPSS